MAAASILPAMSADGNKSIHPFFTRPNGNAQNTPQNTNIDDHETENAQDDPGSDFEDKPKRTNSKRRRAKDGQPAGKKKAQKTLGEVLNPKPAEPAEVVNLCTSEPDHNEDRRKRRRTSETESVEVGSERPSTPVKPVGPLEGAIGGGKCSPRVLIPASSPLPQAPKVESDGILAPKTPPKKLLKLNANGKFSSPPSKTFKQEDEPKLETPKRRSGRQRKSIVSPEKHLLVKLKYGRDDHHRTDLGDRITRILSGEETVAPAQKKAKTTPKKRTPQKPKATHPFFIGKKEQPAPPKESPRKTSAVTPGKLRMQTASDRLQDSKDVPNFGSALLKDRLMVKHPGAKDPPYPSKDNTHIRGSDSYWVKKPMSDETFGRLYAKRKRKQARLPFPDNESILSRFTFQLSAEGERRLRPDGFYEPSEDLTIPERLLISGEEIAQSVARELSVNLPASSGEDELSFTSSQLAIHPALLRLYERIPTTTTAFDEMKGEAQSWTHKYAPTTAAEVLQPSSEVSVLKQWLQSLSIQAVGGAAPIPNKSASSKASERPRKKRKKKADDLDDFLVESDEDVHEMGEIAVSEGLTSIGGQRSSKSVVQVVGDNAKLSNTVLLSGPHGCGKTAAAYAVAKEMGYKVFEIGSTERRSGRDVLDKVGDMTANHLVKHHGTESAEVSSSEEPNRMDEAFEKDLQSGRQGKMNAFFKPQSKPKPKPKQAEPKKVVKEKAIEAAQEVLKKQPKDQQQSLILLEEVDILFKDDKEFWTTVFKLISTSKRPFIMTCNDEDLVPLQAIPLHAILRFTQPPLDLASDYMLLVAAAEGHLLPRNAVTSLYQRHGHDFRASMTELDYWCQMGVGDPREGLTWIYQRWPPGSDVDKQGRKLRVVSKGTYQEGMGVLSSSSSSNEAALSWSWNELGVEPSTALGWTSDPDTGQLPDASADAKEQQRSLKEYAAFADALSAADSCSAVGLPHTAPLDPKQPDLPEKARCNYIEGLVFLQTDESVDYSGMSTDLLVSMTLAAHRNHGFLPDTETSANEQILSTALANKAHADNDALSRRAFGCFDPISSPAEVSLSNPGLLQSVFDGPLETITLDLAPYVRSIVQHDQALEEQRERLSLLTSDGGRKTKRARTTRAARSALEGGQRSTTRKERWFTKDLDLGAVLATGGKGWPRFTPDVPMSVDEGSRASTEVPPAGSVASTEVASMGSMTRDEIPPTSSAEEIKYE